jgi:hypothetical protein
LKRIGTQVHRSHRIRVEWTNNPLISQWTIPIQSESTTLLAAPLSDQSVKSKAAQRRKRGLVAGPARIWSHGTVRSRVGGRHPPAAFQSRPFRTSGTTESHGREREKTDGMEWKCVRRLANHYGAWTKGLPFMLV